MPDCVIKILCRVDNVETKFDGKYVNYYDPTYTPTNGFYDGGMLTVTENIEKARRFKTPKEALDYCWQEHGVRPWDGKPNRPLTAYSMILEECGEVEGGKDEKSRK